MQDIGFLCCGNGRKNLTLGDNRETRQCSHFSKASKLKKITLSVSHLCKKISLTMRNIILQSEIL